MGSEVLEISVLQVKQLIIKIRIYDLASEKCRPESYQHLWEVLQGMITVGYGFPISVPIVGIPLTVADFS